MSPCEVLELPTAPVLFLSCPTPEFQWAAVSNHCQAFLCTFPWNPGLPLCVSAGTARLCLHICSAADGAAASPIGSCLQKGLTRATAAFPLLSGATGGAWITAMFAGFHQTRAASFLIACVIFSRGTHCIKSLIQPAAKGEQSGSLLLAVEFLHCPDVTQVVFGGFGRSWGGERPRCSSVVSLSFAVMPNPPCARGAGPSLCCVHLVTALGQCEINL